MYQRFPNCLDYACVPAKKHAPVGQGEVMGSRVRLLTVSFVVNNRPPLNVRSVVKVAFVDP